MADVKKDYFDPLVTDHLNGIRTTSYTGYDDFILKELGPTTFLGVQIAHVHPDTKAVLAAAEQDLTTHGYTLPPGIIYDITGLGAINSTGHRWGLSIDVNYGSNPYIMHEAGEPGLDGDLAMAYDNIAFFILFKSPSYVSKDMTRGVGVSNAYDRLKEESDAMIKYFSYLNDRPALEKWVADWNTNALAHGPLVNNFDADTWQATIENDYLILGGTLNGVTLPIYEETILVNDPNHPGQKIPKVLHEDRPFMLKGGVTRARRDPKKGFLDIPKEVVVALVKAGFSWGGNGLGGESGDIMHFQLDAPASLLRRQLDQAAAEMPKKKK